MANATKVAVGCKVPHGVVLKIHREALDADTGGKRFVVDEEKPPVTLKGIYANGDGLLHPNGYGITSVDKDFWDAWLLQNKVGQKDHPLVTSGMIFAEPTRDRAADKAEEQANLETGFEGVKPNDPKDRVKQVGEE